jgi:AmmeMemoRadiSam system protein A
MPSIELPAGYSAHQQQILLGLACDSIRYGFEHNRPLQIELASSPAWLRERQASFVTLKAGDMLRGCIGTLEARTALGDDVARNAWAAAFRDPRFQPLAPEEMSGLTLQISILSISEKIGFESEQDLVAKLRPGTDGLILSDRSARGTFLPSVWETLPDPVIFLRHLKLKAGLAEDHWSDDIEVMRYTTETFSGLVDHIEKPGLAYRSAELK